MAEDNQDNEDRTEEATPERREEFRQKGQVAVSKEFTSVAVLTASVAAFSFYSSYFINSIQKMMHGYLDAIIDYRISPGNFLAFFKEGFAQWIFISLPAFGVAALVAIFATFTQTRMNFALKKLKPNFGHLNPLSGIKRMVSPQSLLELFKGIGKISIIGLVSYLIINKSYNRVTDLINHQVHDSFRFWGSLTENLFWFVGFLLLFIAGVDYAFNFYQIEKKLKMTKKEVKDDFKKREVDPHIKGRMRKMQRDLATRKMVEKTSEATVLITNPTHYAVAVKYELGMTAPQVIAKGIDFIALEMRKSAKNAKVPIVENKPLARTLYKTVELDQYIPESLYKAVSEVIRYVFNLKGISTNQQAEAK